MWGKKSSSISKIRSQVCALYHLLWITEMSDSNRLETFVPITVILSSGYIWNWLIRLGSSKKVNDNPRMAWGKLVGVCDLTILGLQWTEQSRVECCPILEIKNNASTSPISLWLYQASHCSLNWIKILLAYIFGAN